MEEKDFEGLPFYIEITETVIEPDQEELKRGKMHEVALSENRKAVTVSIFEKGHEGECLQGLEELRRLAFEDLDKALKLGLMMTIKLLKEQGREISPESQQAATSMLTRPSFVKSRMIGTHASG